MSPLDRPIPPAGEEIHLPNQSIQPFLLALFITIALLGTTTVWYLSAAGGIGCIWVIARWIRESRAELEELPAHHDSDH